MWRSLASPHTTLVVYMPGENYAAVAEQLVSAGFAKSMPCVVISNATKSQQESYRTTIAQLPQVFTGEPVPWNAPRKVDVLLRPHVRHYCRGWEKPALQLLIVRDERIDVSMRPAPIQDPLMHFTQASSMGSMWSWSSL